LGLGSATDYPPDQECLGDERKDLVHLFTIVVASVEHIGVDVIVPPANLFVLEVHVDWEGIEQGQIGEKDSPDEPRNLTELWGGEDR